MRKLALTLAALLAASPAFAHTGGFHTSGLIVGMAHPVVGADHVLAMLAVGLWSGYALPRHFWLGAAAFMAAMAAGAGLGFAGVGLPFVEAGITTSVVLFGILALVARPGQGAGITAASLAAIAVFASFHGLAHANEATGAALPYLAGFLAVTGALHLAGIALARGVARYGLAQRAMGGAIIASGVLLALA
ncbi:MAG: HupE/UreJ family protein [Burkholderiaceae bacterium]|nr:HupE/UreJ family protein [Burkholderiaceae bacterium]